MTDRTTCQICFFPFQTEGRGTVCNPLRTVRTMGMVFLMSKLKGSTATGLWIFPYSPRHVRQDVRGDKNVSRMPLLPSNQAWVFCCEEPCRCSRSMVQSVAEQKKHQWFLFHEQRCVVVVETGPLILRSHCETRGQGKIRSPLSGREPSLPLPIAERAVILGGPCSVTESKVFKH